MQGDVHPAALRRPLLLQRLPAEGVPASARRCAVIEYGHDYPDPDEADRLNERAAELREKLVETTDLDSLPVPEALIDGVLYRNSLVWVQGRPGSAKSFVALDIAGCIGGNLSWQGFPALPDTVELYVLYVIAEGTSGLRQ